MTQWALILNGVVSEITDIDPAGRFVPSWQWEEIPAGATVAAGYGYADGAFTSPPGPTLAQAQASQGDDVKGACAAAIMAGFSSGALGAARSYGSQTADQMNIDRASIAGGSIWCADSSGAWSLVSHTAAQAAQVRTDLRAHIQACQTKYAGLLGQISGATTVSAVQSISW